ncbi:hypothetical protein G2W53_018001 [Senna tora]|uniref:Uncharacterized protein n=1 Tax=Senna tora TaxID=362788 RepID=A0A834WKZ3_9FABA|nr:hypothetical protein G2W53_018001 [Senna tora]
MRYSVKCVPKLAFVPVNGVYHPAHGCLGELWRDRSFPVLVADDDFTDEVVVLGFLVCGDKYNEALANVDIKGVVVVFDGLPCLHGVDNLILAIAFYVFAIDEDTIRPAERSATVQQLLESGVGLGVPVTHKNVELYYLECEKHDAEPRIVPLLLSLR